MNDIESKLKNIDGFAIKMDNMFKMIETNDNNIKLEVANKFQNVEQAFTKASQAQRAMVGTELMSMRNEIKSELNGVTTEVTSIRDGAQNAFTTMRTEMGQLDSLAKTTHDEASKMIAKRDNEHNMA